MSSLEDACVLLYSNRLRRASRAHAGRPAQSREGLGAYDHSRSMATGTGPDVRKCRGRQACRAGNTCNQAQQSKHTTDKLKGDTRGGGGTRVTKRRAFLRRTCQSRGAQVVGGGWTDRNGLRGGIGRLHVDLRRRNLGTTARCRNCVDLVSSHAMIKVLGGLLSSNE